MAVRRTTVQRWVWWRRHATLQQANQLLIAEFIVKGGFQFLINTAGISPHELVERLEKRLDNLARRLFENEFGNAGHREHHSVGHTDSTFDPSLLIDTRALENSPALIAERRDTITMLRTAMQSTLADNELAVIDRRVFEGRSLKETARLVNRSRWFVRRTYATAIKKLKNALAKSPLATSTHGVSAADY